MHKIYSNLPVVIMISYGNDDSGQTSLARRTLISYHDCQLMSGYSLSIQIINGGNNPWRIKKMMLKEKISDHEWLHL